MTGRESRPLVAEDRLTLTANTRLRYETIESHQIEARVRYWLIPKRLRLDWKGLLLAKSRFLHEAANAVADGDTLYNSFNATISL